MRGSGARWSLVDYLKSTDNRPVTSISWSPNGRYPSYSDVLVAFGRSAKLGPSSFNYGLERFETITELRDVLRNTVYFVDF